MEHMPPFTRLIKRWAVFELVIVINTKFVRRLVQVLTHPSV